MLPLGRPAIVYVSCPQITIEQSCVLLSTKMYHRDNRLSQRMSHKMLHLEGLEQNDEFLLRWKGWCLPRPVSIQNQDAEVRTDLESVVLNSKITHVSRKYLPWSIPFSHFLIPVSYQICQFYLSHISPFCTPTPAILAALALVYYRLILSSVTGVVFQLLSLLIS